MKSSKKLLLFITVALALLITAPALPASAAGTCSCYGTISAGALLAESTFDSYCSNVKQYCSSCGNGTATCQGSFSTTEDDCEKLNSDTSSQLSKYGISSIAIALVDISGSCTYTSSAKSSSKSSSGISILPSCAKDVDEVLKLSCGLELAGSVSKWILGITGSLALLYFVYGGFMLLISRGNEQQIAKGKEILSHAIIGVIIVFGAYFLIDFLTKAIGFQESQFKIQEESSKSSSSYDCYCTDSIQSGSNLIMKTYSSKTECDTSCNTKSGGECEDYKGAQCKAKSSTK